MENSHCTPPYNTPECFLDDKPIVGQFDVIFDGQYGPYLKCNPTYIGNTKYVDTGKFQCACQKASTIKMKLTLHHTTAAVSKLDDPGGASGSGGSGGVIPVEVGSKLPLPLMLTCTHSNSMTSLHFPFLSPDKTRGPLITRLTFALLLANASTSA